MEEVKKSIWLFSSFSYITQTILIFNYISMRHWPSSCDYRMNASRSIWGLEGLGIVGQEAQGKWLKMVADAKQRTWRAINSII